ncbi:MAG: acetyl/propionyl/methylcrotonyl-CoA carboxylase subunit alpha [Aeromicrobium sp.]|nr:acetyl/propionyl/methylcrotonyl-CoA carboxylase subunit alpha [Burkholderiales bacterium]
MFRKILVANRGEIACRVMRTCKRLGIQTVAVYSDADANAQHVLQADESYHIGGSRPADSYLKADVILAVAKQCGAEALHPGYGFLSENADFSQACEDAGITFIGPTPDSIQKMGSKSAAKVLMEAAGVPVVPGYHGNDQDPAFLAYQSKLVGYPQLIKAVAGGGGKGMRLVEKADEFMSQLDAVKREAKNAFGDDDVLIERFIKGPHHIEFQVFGDTHGNFVHLFERECSIQRRHQKILEETPSPFLDQVDDLMRDTMGAAALAAARAINYRGAGTIEFIAGENREFFFMEMNTRLQVEHPITEMITGEDLVEWQLLVASSEELPLLQGEIITGGHAIEVRICAENPENDFLPEIGPLHVFATPMPIDGEDVRLDTGVAVGKNAGDEISIFYDPMIAKLITWGGDRPEAIRRMQAALAETEVIGVKTNLGFLQSLVHHPAFLAGDTDTSFIAKHKMALLQPTPIDDFVLAAACAGILQAESLDAPLAPDVWDNTAGWRLNTVASRLIEFKAGENEIVCHVQQSREGLRFKYGDTACSFAWTERDDDSFHIRLDGSGKTCRFVKAGNDITILTETGRVRLTLFDPYHFEGDTSANDGRLTAMMPGRIVKLMAAAGDKVSKGQPLIIMEAVEMEHTIVSPRDGVVERVAFQVGEMVPADAVLFAFAE